MPLSAHTNCQAEKLKKKKHSNVRVTEHDSPIRFKL